jgi:hypothetical protein
MLVAHASVLCRYAFGNLYHRASNRLLVTINQGDVAVVIKLLFLLKFYYFPGLVIIRAAFALARLV